MKAGLGETGLKQRSQRFWNCAYSFGYLLLYAVSLGLLYKIEHFDVSEPLFVLMVLGVDFSVLAWWTTRSVVPLPLDVKKPGEETMILLAYLVALAVFITWGLPAVGALVPTEPWKSVSILAAKLAAFVVVPMVLFCALGYTVHNFSGTPSQWRQHLRPGLWMALILILFQAVFGRGLSEIRHSGLPARTLLLGVPFTYVWLLVEVGIGRGVPFSLPSAVAIIDRTAFPSRWHCAGLAVVRPRPRPGSLSSTRGDAGGCRRPSILADGGGLLHRDHIRGWRLPGCVVGADTEPYFGHGGPCCGRLVAKPCANRQELAVALPSGGFSVPESCHVSQRSESHA